MQTMFSKLLSVKLVLILTFISIVPGTASADEFEYFKKDIDFWNEKQVKKAEDATPKVEKPRVSPEKQTGESFSWGKYLDPKNKEFFKEGDYSPPEPFLEIVRNPTDENLKMWFSYIDRKNQLFSRLQKRMSEYASQNPGSTQAPQVLEARVSQMPKVAPDAKRFRFRMYFDSTCPHCQKMFGTMATLQEKGFFVEARQVDKGPMPTLPFPTEFASHDETKQKDIQSVPILLIGDLKKKVIYRMNGFQTPESIFNEISHQGP